MKAVFTVSRRSLLAFLSVVAFLLPQMSSSAAVVPPVQISADPYVNATSQHQSQVESDSFAWGATVVSAFQSGRFYSGGGSSNISWATSFDGGGTWTHGDLPSTTVVASPPGSWGRASDPSVAFDAAHGTWLATFLAMTGETGPRQIMASRSSDGLSWSAPVAVSTQSDLFDKDWVTCDSTSTSPFYGRCYVAWSDTGVAPYVLYSSTSLDGGASWGPAVIMPVASGSPLVGSSTVQPNGTVVVFSAIGSQLAAHRSVDGGASWLAPVTVATISQAVVRGALRVHFLPSGEAAGDGRLFVSWFDCRFEPSCRSNDAAFSSSADGVTWSTPQRIPLWSVGATNTSYLVGLGVDHDGVGSSTRLALTYYAEPRYDCGITKPKPKVTPACVVNVGFATSPDAGATWTVSAPLNPVPMMPAWMPNTTQGFMVGDYMAASVGGGSAVGVFAMASAPSGGVLGQSMFAVRR